MFFNTKTVTSVALAVATIFTSVSAAPAESDISTRAVSRKGYFKVIRTDPGNVHLGWLSKSADGTGFRTTQDESQRLVVSFTAPDNGTPFAIKTWNSNAPSTPFLGLYPGYVGVDGSFSYAYLAGATSKNAAYTPPVNDESGRGPRETTLWLFNPTTLQVNPANWINPDGSKAPTGQLYYSEHNHIQYLAQMKAPITKRVSDAPVYPIKFQWFACDGTC